jgi:hypothetical protein
MQLRITRRFRLVRSLLGAALVVVVAALAATPALAGRGLVVGVNENAAKWRPVSLIGNDLNLGYYRLTQGWQPGQAQPSALNNESLATALANAGAQRILLSVSGTSSSAPLTASSRAEYCSFVSSLLDRFPQIASVNIWNEANLSYFWKPQFNRNGSSAAPAAYEALLAHCYDTIKSRHPLVRLITSVSPRGNDNPRARSNISHSARNFIKKMAGVPPLAPPCTHFRRLGPEHLWLELARAPLGAPSPRHRRG